MNRVCDKKVHSKWRWQKVGQSDSCAERKKLSSRGTRGKRTLMAEPSKCRVKA